MMRISLIVCCWLMCAAFGEAPNWFGTKSDIQEMNLKGAVMSIQQRVYEATTVDNSIKKRHLMLDPLENWDINFNKKGFISEKKCYGADNELIFFYEYKYKQKTQLHRKKMYDAKNYTIEEVLYAYNSLGQLAAESIYRADLSLLVRYIYNYSPKGLLIRTDVHAPTTDVYTSSRYEFDYNKESQLVERRTYNTKEQLHQTDYFTYDNYGHLKEHQTKNHLDNFLFTAHSRHDIDGNLMTYQAPAENTPSTSYTYIFDEVGNWISKTHYKKGKVQTVIERKIEYLN